MARLVRRFRRSAGPARERPHVPLRYVGSLAIVCGLLLLLDLTGLRYGYLDYEKSTGGWALTAFAAALVALALAALLRPILVRRHDLYGDDDD